jgi:hypothetical protein
MSNERFDEREKAFMELRTAWGNKLLSKYPGGIPTTDFSNLLDRLTWVNEALTNYTAQNVTLGLPILSVVGGNRYSDVQRLS